ncbi:MAG: hypothetical protein M1812_007569 [Candelaria pacifica]|nr:MAG: hypothetical protein M1812_007569 [Candelaria pacifica]
MATTSNGTTTNSGRAMRSAKRRKLNTYGRNTSRSMSSPLQTLENVVAEAFQHTFDGDTSLRDVDLNDRDTIETRDQATAESPTASKENDLQPGYSADETDHLQRQSRIRHTHSRDTVREVLGHEQEIKLSTNDSHVSAIPSNVISASEGPSSGKPLRSLEAAALENKRLEKRDISNDKEFTNGHESLDREPGGAVDSTASHDTPVKRKRGRPRKYPKLEAEVDEEGGGIRSKQKRHDLAKGSLVQDRVNRMTDVKLSSEFSRARKDDCDRRSPKDGVESTPSRRGRRSQGKTKVDGSGQSKRVTRPRPSPRTLRTNFPTSPVTGRLSRQNTLESRTVSNGSLNPSEPKLNGILTPTKRKVGRPKKLVKFQSHEQKDIEEDLGFKDIPTRSDPTRDTSFTVSPIGLGQESDVIDYNSSFTSTGKGYRSTREEPVAERPHRPNVNTQENPSTFSTAFPQADDESLPDDPVNHAGHEAEFGHLANASSLFTVVQTVLLGKLTGRRRIQLVGLEEECEKVRQVVEQTVVAGEGNSMIIIGARGSGKSAIVESIISDLVVDHNSDFHVVRLNGFIHTDDKLALRDIWRQLGKEMKVDEDAMNKTSNYADTLSSLLALLSHPSELAQNETDETSKSVIFIMDEFDLFTSHPRQTLLYNLFDIAQSRKAPIAVLGLTSRVDVTESLEKRVKSRFSHRYVYLSLPKTPSSFWAVCKEGLTISADDLLPAISGNEGHVEEEALMSSEGTRFLESWNEMIETHLFQDPTFTSLLQSIFYRTKSVKDFFATALLPIASLTLTTLPLTGQSFTQNMLSSPESKLDILPGLSDLDLALLIAAARLDIILDTDTCNFNMAYEEYTTLASRMKVQSSASGAAAFGAGSKIWGREVAIGAWEKLMDYELLVPAIGTVGGGAAVSGTGGGAGSREVSRAGKMVRVDVGLEEILPSVPGMSAVMAKWCREL